VNTRRLAAMLLALAGLAAPAHAEMRALLVGVSGYPTLDKRYQLEGPRNDVRLMREVLLQRGFPAAQITLLADGLSEAPPTRDNILAALDRLAGAAQPGDTVFIHFAGHGSQQPVDRNTPEGKDEPDGLSETFLPLDVGRWDGSVHTVSCARGSTASLIAAPSSGACSTPATRPRWCAAATNAACATAASTRSTSG
jgi:hypothetical protein